MQPLVSIIIPCYNQAEYLSETLDSVLAQSYPNWEGVIVNDGSTDKTDEVAGCYCKKDPRFKYVKQENKGLSSARNTGIARSSGEYILPLDSDDIIAPTYLEKIVSYFLSSPEAKLVYCKAKKFGKVNCYWNLPQYDYNSFIWNNCIFCTAMFRRVDYDMTKGYNENMKNGYEDWDFWLTLLKKEDIVYRVDEVLFYYRVKEKSMVTESSSRYLNENLLLVCRHHPDIYEPYKDRIVMYYQQLEKIPELQSELESVYSSHAYRLGKFLLKPLSWIKNRLS